MDIRIKKTRRGIINAFLELRSRKPLEKITVKELCEKAEINKSTFYTHFTDVYALSEFLEGDAIAQIIQNLPHPEYILERPREFTFELFHACLSQSVMIGILFSGSRTGQLVIKLEEALRELIFKSYPQYREDAFVNVYLSYAIYGSYYAMLQSPKYGDNIVVDALSEISQHGAKLLEKRIAR